MLPRYVQGEGAQQCRMAGAWRPREAGCPQRWQGLSRLLQRGLLAWCLLIASGMAFAQAQRTSTGTGFFISEDGYFITCFHVVVNSSSITLRNLAGETFEARAIAVDRSNDLALLKAEIRDGRKFKPLPLASSGDVRRGAAVVTMGFPNIGHQGIEPKVTDGIINSFSGANNDNRVSQISAPIQTGNSGGPLITLDGNVVGVVASKLDAQAMARQTGDIPQNVNYAIKSQHVLDLLEKVAAQIPAVRASLATPGKVEKARVADVVPALEDAIALVLATPVAVTTRPRERQPENGSQSHSQANTREPGKAVSPPAADSSVPVPGPAPGAQPEARSGSTAARESAEERARQMGRMVVEYRQLQQQVNALSFDELTLINQANMLKLMLRFDQGGMAGQRQADLTAIQRRLDDISTRKAEMVKRMNELAGEYRAIQQGTS